MDSFGREEAAYESFARLMKQGKECRALFELARLPLPSPLARFLGEVAPVHQGSEQKIIVPPPDPPPRPPEWQEGWIWVRARDVTPTTLVRGILRQAHEAMSPKIIAASVESLKGGVVVLGTIANIGTRLDKAGLITRENGAWRIADRTSAPVIHDGYVWGPMDAFDDLEVAIHRRMLIVHVLRAHSDGLQIIQITKVMQTCDWVRTPLSKDLVKTDLHTLLGEAKVRRVGNTGKWTAKEDDVSP